VVIRNGEVSPPTQSPIRHKNTASDNQNKYTTIRNFVNMKKLLLLLSLLFLTSTCFAQTSVKPIIKDKDKQVYRTQLGEDNDEVIIGGKNPLVFEPEIQFFKWNKENSLTIKPLFDIPNATTSLVGNKIEHKGDKIGWYANPDPENADNLKFGLILYEKPATNVFQFQLEGWEEFDFLYQKPLANQYPNGSYWEDDGKGGIRTCPEEIAGSYAVYHKTKANYEIGKVNYQIGKFGHIFRPRLLDTDGLFLCWVDLLIKDGIYTLTVDQKTLDTAKYPLKFNDWFGNQGTGAKTATNNNCPSYCLSLSTPASNGAMTSMSIYGRDWDGDGERFCPALYSNVSSLPSARLAKVDSGGTAFDVTTTWYTTNLAYASIVASTQYWLGMKSGINGTHFLFNYDDGSAGERQMGASGEGAYPDPATVIGEDAMAYRVSIYATYTPAGGAAATGTIMMVD